MRRRCRLWQRLSAPAPPPPGSGQPPAPAPGAAPRRPAPRHQPPGSCAAPRRPSVPLRGIGPGRPLDRAPVPPGQRVADRAADLPLLHPDAGRAAPTDGVWVPYTDATEQKLLDDFKRLWGTNFLDNLWIEVNDDAYHERRGRQARDLPHGRAAAREDRRLHRVDQGRAHQGRREDEGARHLAAPRLVPRRRRRAARQGHRPRPDGREGLPVRRGQLVGRGAARRPEAGEGGLRRPGRPAGQASATINFDGNNGDRRRHAASAR